MKINNLIFASLKFTGLALGSGLLSLGTLSQGVLAQAATDPIAPKIAIKNPPLPSILPAETEYTLGPGDRLRMDIYQVQGFNGEYQVLVDGSIGFPLVGVVNVQGKTIPQLTQLLNQQYAKYIKRPVITVLLLQPRPLTVTLAGEVNRPGSYTLVVDKGQKFPALTDIIQQAGGLTPVADIGQIEVRRETAGNSKQFRVNLWELLQKGDKRQNITLRDGDSIVILSKVETDPQEVRQLVDANFGIRFEQEISIAVVGEVFRPGAYKLTPGSASNRGEVGGATGGGGSGDAVRQSQPIRLTQAIQEAGGIKPQADIRQIQVRRQARSGQEELISVNLWELLETGNLDNDVVLQNGDTVSIPAASTLSASESGAMASANFSPKTIRVQITGEVKGPGLIELPPNSTLNQAILAGGGFNPVRADQENVNLIRLNPDGTVTRLTVRPDFSQGVSSENNPTLRNNDIVLVNTSGLASATDTINTFFSPIGALFGGIPFGVINAFD